MEPLKPAFSLNTNTSEVLGSTPVVNGEASSGRAAEAKPEGEGSDAQHTSLDK